MTKHYLKRLVANGISVGGRDVPFIRLLDPLGDGVIATDNEAIQQALDLRIEERRGGVSLITPEQYAGYLQRDDAAKKAGSAKPSPLPSGPRASVNPSLASLGGVVAAPANPAPKPFRKSASKIMQDPVVPTVETGAP